MLALLKVTRWTRETRTPPVPITTYMEQKPLMNARQVGHLLNISAWTVYEFARRGHLSCVRMGAKCVRFRPEDVEQFIRDHRVPNEKSREDAGHPLGGNVS